MRWEVKQGDRAKSWLLQLEDEDGNPDLRDVDVYLVAGNVDTNVDPEENGNIVRLIPELEADPEDEVDAQHGWVRVDWIEPELDVIGVFKAEFRAIFNPGTPQEAQETFPSDEYDYLVVKSPATAVVA